MTCHVEHTDNVGPQEDQDILNQHAHTVATDPLTIVAASCIGYESTSTDSTFGEWYGEQLPWSVIGVSWCANQVGLTTDMGMHHCAHCLREVFVEQNQFGHQAQQGAVAFFRFTGQKVHHVGVVEKITPGGVITVEFNTNVLGSRDGGKVMRKFRNRGIAGYGYLDAE